ncbi:hypothetical protein CR513_49149, partial [Mucuna pruriens]
MDSDGHITLMNSSLPDASRQPIGGHMRLPLIPGRGVADRLKADRNIAPCKHGKSSCLQHGFGLRSGRSFQEWLLGFSVSASGYFSLESPRAPCINCHNHHVAFSRGASSFSLLPLSQTSLSAILLRLLPSTPLSTCALATAFFTFFPCSSWRLQGLLLTLALLSTGNLFEDAPGTSTQGVQSPAESIPRGRPTASGGEPSPSSSSSYITYPFEIWYRDDSRDSLVDEPYAWVDDEVKKTFTQLNRSSSLLGMAKAICKKGPWSVRVSPCRTGESVNISSPTEENRFFYLYDTLHSKLGIRLPFSHFERAVLQALNVAPTQLHPNSWAYVRAFELLCEDLGKAPSLGVFFLFYTVKKAEKVGWTSLCSRPKRKLFQPFLASYKKFKTQFFKVTPGDVGPNLLADRAGRPFFPLYWTHQPAVSITVNLDDLDSWEKVFAMELSKLPLLPSAKIIKGDDYSSKVLRELKRKAAERADKGKEPTTSAEPIAAAEPSSQQATTEAGSDTASLVVVQEVHHETAGAEVEDVVSDSPLRFEEPTSDAQAALNTQGVPDVEEERPLKRRAIEDPAIVGAVDGESRPSSGFQWDSLLSGVPSSSTRGPPPLLGQAVDQGLGPENNQVKELGVAGTCKIVQQHAAYALIFARAAEKEFGKLESHCRAYERRAAKFEADFLNASKACTEAELKINSYRSATANLEEDLRRTVAKNKDLTSANFELNTAVGYANSKVETLQRENEGLGSSLQGLREELASAESSLKRASEDVQSRDETVRLLEQTIEAQNQRIKEQEETVVKMGEDIVEQFEAGFAKALGQVHFLHPDIDISEADPFKDLIDGQLVLAPSPPDSPAAE